MLYLMLALFSFSTFAAEKCTPSNLRILQCISMRDNIIKQAVIKGPKEDAVFVKDEKLALTYIKGFDLSKLANDEDRCVSETIVQECKTSPKKFHLKCDAKLDILTFFSALAPALKENNWSKKTVALGEDLIKNYVASIYKSNPELLEQVLTLVIIQKSQAQGLLKNDYINVDAMVKKAEKVLEENLAYREKVSPEFDCKIANEANQREKKLSEDLLMEWQASQKRK